MTSFTSRILSLRKRRLTLRKMPHLPSRSERVTRLPTNLRRASFKLLNTAYDKYADETGWADVSAAGSFFKRQDPGFDTVDYGFRKLTDLIEYFDDDFEMKKESGSSRRHVTFYFRPVEK